MSKLPHYNGTAWISYHGDGDITLSGAEQLSDANRGRLTVTINDRRERHFRSREHLHTDAATGEMFFRIALTELPHANQMKLAFRHECSEHTWYDTTLIYNRGVHELQDKIRASLLQPWYLAEFSPQLTTLEDSNRYFFNCGIHQDDNPNPWFDNAWIREKYANFVKPHHIPLVQYFRQEPNDRLSASQDFHPRRYRNQNKDLNAQTSPLAHYVQRGHREKRRTASFPINDEVRRQFSAGAQLDPTIKCTSGSFGKHVKYPHYSTSTPLPGLAKALCDSAKPTVLCTTSLCAQHPNNTSYLVAKELAQQLAPTGDLLVVVTGGEAADLGAIETLPFQYINLGHLQGTSTEQERAVCLHEVIAEVNCGALILVDSAEAEAMLRLFPMQLSAALDTYFLCTEAHKDSLDECTRNFGLRVAPLMSAIDYLWIENERLSKRLQHIYGFSANTLQAERELENDKDHAVEGLEPKAALNLIQHHIKDHLKRSTRMPDRNILSVSDRLHTYECDRTETTTFNRLAEAIARKLSTTHESPACQESTELPIAA